MSSIGSEESLKIIMAGPYLSPLGPQADLLTEYMFGRRRQVSVGFKFFISSFIFPFFFYQG